MNIEEEKKIVTDLATSPEFFQALMTCYENTNGSDIDIREVALWFFSKGYFSCMDYQEKKDKLRPFKYEPPM